MFQGNIIRICGFLILTSDIFVTQTGAKVVQLHGAGATFPSEVYSRWIAAYKQYRKDHVTLNMTYDAVGSGTGKAFIKGEQTPDRPIVYVGSDILLSDEEQKQLPNLKSLPVMAGAVAVVFNLEDTNNINLSIGALCGIYNGTIRFWNHQVIQDMNPAHRLPNKEITVIARSDKSGTTHTFVSALAASCPDWVFSHDDEGLPVEWDSSTIHFFGYGNRGMTGLILSLPYSIGYATVADIYFSKLKYAKIQNNAGNFVEASTETVQNAIRDSGNQKSLLSPEGKQSYPIAAYTFFIVEQSQQSSCESTVELVRYIDWFYRSPSAHLDCEAFYMVPMEQNVAENITNVFLQTITCGGQNVWDLVEEQKRLETREEVALAFYISISCISCLATVGIILFGRQSWLMYKDILKDKWLIPFTEIRFERENIEKIRSSINSPSFDPTIDSRQSPQIRYAWGPRNIQVGVINSELVFLIRAHSEMKTNTFKAKKTLMWFCDSIEHVNVAKLVGLTKSSIRWISIYKGETRGSVVDITRSEDIKISTAGLVVLCKEILQGMEYLQKKGIVHGNLKGSCCLVDMIWKVKITDWHFTKLRSIMNKDNNRYDIQHKTENEDIISLFWVAPELIKFQRSPTHESDVFSFGILMQELFSRAEPYNEILLPPKEIVIAILSCGLRPRFAESTPPFLRTLMDKTWEIDPAARPDFVKLRQHIKCSYPNDNSLTDCIVKSLEEYATTLEKQLSEARHDIIRAQEASKAVLLDHAPALVVEKFLRNEKLEPTSYKLAAVLACSFLNMSHYVSLFSTEEVVKTLEELMTGIDLLAHSRNVTKLSLNGENLVFSSDPKSPALVQVQTIGTFSIMLMNLLDRVSKNTPAHYALKAKIGIATGPVFVSSLGKRFPKYSVFGEAVTQAFNVLSVARQRTIRMSKDAYELIKQRGLMFVTTILKDGPKGENGNSYWLVSQEGLEGKFDPILQS